MIIQNQRQFNMCAKSEGCWEKNGKIIKAILKTRRPVDKRKIREVIAMTEHVLAIEYVDIKI